MVKNRFCYFKGGCYKLMFKIKSGNLCYCFLNKIFINYFFNLVNFYLDFLDEYVNSVNLVEFLVSLFFMDII